MEVAAVRLDWVKKEDFEGKCDALSRKEEWSSQMKGKFQSIQWIDYNSIYQQWLEATRKPEIGHYGVSKHANQTRTEFCTSLKNLMIVPTHLPAG